MARSSSRWLFFFSLLGILLVPHTGCAYSKPDSYRTYSEAPSEQILLTPGPSFYDPAFLAKWLGPLTERDKIRYLLDRIGGSSDRFIRNGKSYDGKVTRRWLLYKSSHWVRKVKTAEDFISRAASYSQKSGKPYLVKLEGEKIYPLRKLLRNELSAFEHHVMNLRHLGRETLIESESPSLQAPPVASPTR